jgi:hypothetical protein
MWSQISTSVSVRRKIRKITENVTIKYFLSHIGVHHTSGDGEAEWGYWFGAKQKVEIPRDTYVGAGIH